MRLTKYYIVFLLMITCVLACDTESNVEPRFYDYFVKYYGEAGNQTGSYFIQTSDGGFLIIGTTINNADDKDIYLVKTDSIGNQLWSASYGRTDFDEEGITLVAKPLDAGYYLAGNKTSINSTTDIFLVDIDLNGVQSDSATIGDTNFNEEVRDLLITSNDEIIVAGSTTNLSPKPSSGTADTHDFYFPKLDMNLDTVPSWTGKYGFDSEDRIQSVAQKPDGKLIFLGTSNKDVTADPDKDQYNMIVFQISINGLPDADDQTFGTLGNENAGAMSPTSDGGYVMVGTTVSDSGEEDIFVSRINASNGIIGSYPVTSPLNINGKSIYEVSGGGYIILGSIANNANNNIFLRKTNAVGATIWERTFGGNSDDLPGRVIQLPDKSFVFVGTATLDNQSKVVLIKTNEDGDLIP